MTVFNNPNRDAAISAPTEEGSMGPRVGFLESFDSAWKAHALTASQNGFEEALAEAEDEQLRKARSKGAENVPMIGADRWALSELVDMGADDDAFMYTRAAKYFSGKTADDDTKKRIEDRDKWVNDFNAKNPDTPLMTSRELFDDIKQRAIEADTRENNRQGTTLGAVGGFAGDVISSMNPETDELNFLTMGFGGVGKTAAMRIGTEVAGQGLIETLNQATGVQSTREMLGLSSGFEDAAGRVVGTAVGAGVLRGVGELGYYAGKRWFAPEDGLPMPPQPPAPRDEPLLLEYKPRDKQEWEGQAEWEADVKAYQQKLVSDLMNGTRDYADDILPMAGYGPSIKGQARARADLDYTTRQLEAWDGPEPYRMRPPTTSTAIPSRVEGVEMQEFKIDHSQKNIDLAAREYDPKTFRLYDDLATKAKSFREWLQDPRYKQDIQESQRIARAEFEDLSVKVDNLRYNIQQRRVGGRTLSQGKIAEMQDKLNALQAKRDEAIQASTVNENPTTATIRVELIKTLDKMQDMAPLVSRAYSHAKGVWEAGQAERDAVAKMIREARTELPQTEGDIRFEYDPLAIFETPRNNTLLRDADSVEPQMRDDATDIDRMEAVVKNQLKEMDVRVEEFRGQLEKLSKLANGEYVTMNGQTYKFDLDGDKVFIPNEKDNGVQELSLRQLLEDAADSEAELKAMTTCSM